jgi:hypothetical protein
MPRSCGSFVTVALALATLTSACTSSGQDATDRRRSLARQTCEDAVRGQLSSRATAQFPSDSEHVYYDSAGGAAVAGAVATSTGVRSFACVLKPATDSTWTISDARLLN